jgi:hypothetical protein
LCWGNTIIGLALIVSRKCNDHLFVEPIDQSHLIWEIFTCSWAANPTKLQTQRFKGRPWMDAASIEKEINGDKLASPIQLPPGFVVRLERLR